MKRENDCCRRRRARLRILMRNGEKIEMCRLMRQSDAILCAYLVRKRDTLFVILKKRNEKMETKRAENIKFIFSRLQVFIPLDEKRNIAFEHSNMIESSDGRLTQYISNTESDREEEYFCRNFVAAGCCCRVCYAAAYYINCERIECCDN